MSKIEYDRIMMAVTLVEEAAKGNISFDCVTTEELDMANEWYEEEIKRKKRYLESLKGGNDGH